MCLKNNLNILKWYPFKENDRVFIMDDDTLPPSDQQYDFIVLLGITHKQTLKSTILSLKGNLAENGSFLIAVDNKFGIRFFAGNPENVLGRKFVGLIGYNNESEKIETYTKSSLEKQLKSLGFNTRFYYPLPDYRLPNVIFTDEQLPQYNSIDKYTPYCSENSDILFNEIDVFREILKTDADAFTFFANSFFIEATEGTCDTTYKYISFNNLRKEEFQLITKIADTYVEKQPVSDEATKHYENIKKNIEILKTKSLATADYIEAGIIKSKYIEQKYLLNNVLTEKLEQGNITEFRKILNGFVKKLNSGSYTQTDYEKTVFAKYQIEYENKEIISSMHFLENGLWDMTFSNCFYKDNEFLFYDQEWNEPALPAEFILYRSFLYTISLRRYININLLFEEYNLTPYLELFEKLDNKLQESVRSNEQWEFYSKNKFIDIDATKQELTNLNIRNHAVKGENDNLKNELKALTEKNQELLETIQLKQQQLDNRLSAKIRRFIKRIKFKLNK